MKKRNKIKAKQQRAFLHLAHRDGSFEKLRTGPSKNSGQALRPAWAGSGQALRNAQDRPIVLLWRGAEIFINSKAKLYHFVHKNVL